MRFCYGYDSVQSAITGEYMKHIEIENFVTLKSVEYAHGRAIVEQKRNNTAFAEIGMRAARQRDAKLLKVLDKATEVMVRAEENQRKHQMSTSDKFSERRYTTETQMWREAYRMVDEGKAAEVPHLMWIYAAAAFLCGYQL